MVLTHQAEITPYQLDIIENIEKISMLQQFDVYKLEAGILVHADRFFELMLKFNPLQLLRYVLRVGISGFFVLVETQLKKTQALLVENQNGIASFDRKCMFYVL